MRSLAKTCVIFAVCLLTTQGAKAIDWSKPFVAITVPRESLYLGVVYESNANEAVARATAHVVANCPYHVSAAFDGLRHEETNVAIAPSDLVVKINGKLVPVGGNGVRIASNGPTPRNGVEVPIEMQVGVKTIQPYPAGRYSGALMITVTAGF
jgi:hypothetical protein